MMRQRQHRTWSWKVVGLVVLGAVLGADVRAQPLMLEAALVSSGAERIGDDSFHIDATVGQPAVGRVAAGALGVELGFFTVQAGMEVGTEEAGTPLVFALAAPFPNPFARTTTIAYTLPEGADVWLEVFDVLGRRVRTLVAAEQAAGHHAVPFEAGALASGVYLVRITAGAYTATRRMQLVR
jgi:hypothetical protein